MKGSFIGTPVSWELTKAKSTGNPQVAVVFMLEGGVKRTWYGMFLPTQIDRTLDSLKYCGWDGVSIRALAGMGTKKVELVIDEEMNNQTGELRDRVRWVNRLGNGGQPLPESEGDELEQLVRTAMATKAGAAAPAEDPFKNPFEEQ